MRQGARCCERLLAVKGLAALQVVVTMMKRILLSFRAVRTFLQQFVTGHRLHISARNTLY
jgi:hypothetical protein